MPIAIRLVPANLKLQEEALNRFVECHSMLSEFVALEVVLEIRRRKPMPIDHGLSFRAVAYFEIRCRPNVSVRPAQGWLVRA